MTSHTIKVEPIMVVLTPYALARSAHHLFCMARDYEADGDADLMRHYLFCVSIELGLKAAILGEDCTNANKILLKRIGHDLVELQQSFQSILGIALFDADDMDAIQSINSHFKQKGLEYFTLPVLESTLKARSDMPTVERVNSAAAKVNDFLASNQFIRDGKTSEPTAGGILNFV